MQNQLIPVFAGKIQNNSTQLVNARDLHQFLEVGKDFSNWIKDRINKYDFVEFQDFIVFANSGENPKGGRPSSEYHITIDMGKELAMVEKNVKGKEARRYFIECEKQLKQQPAIDPMQVLNDPAAMRGLLLTYTEQVIELKDRIGVMEPKVQTLDRITAADGEMNVTNAAKTLNLNPMALFKYLEQQKWIYRRAGGRNWTAYQDKIQSGVLKHKITTVLKDDGSERVCEQVLVTPKGLTKLSRIFVGQAA